MSKSSRSDIRRLAIGAAFTSSGDEAAFVALAYAIVLYLVALVPKILTGAVLLISAPRELTAGLVAWRRAGGRA